MEDPPETVFLGGFIRSLLVRRGVFEPYVEASFIPEFERHLMAKVEGRVGRGGRLFLEEHNQNWRGYRAIVREEAVQRAVDVDQLSRREMVEAVIEHLEEFREEYELDDYGNSPR